MSTEVHEEAREIQTRGEVRSLSHIESLAIESFSPDELDRLQESLNTLAARRSLPWIPYAMRGAGAG